MWSQAFRAGSRKAKGRAPEVVTAEARQPETWLINVTAASMALLNFSGEVAGVQAGSGDTRSEALERAEEGRQGDLRIRK